MRYENCFDHSVSFGLKYEATLHTQLCPIPCGHWWLPTGEVGVRRMESALSQWLPVTGKEVIWHQLEHREFHLNMKRTILQ